MLTVGCAATVPDVERLKGEPVTLKWCPVVRREYAVLDATADATPFSQVVVGGGAHDDARARKLCSVLSRGTGCMATFQRGSQFKMHGL